MVKKLRVFKYYIRTEETGIFFFRVLEVSWQYHLDPLSSNKNDKEITPYARSTENIVFLLLH